ncbi:hypothetical protein H0H92_013235 [Tricholoma furcatifolium]|nr:hypothetical protein H0H92_013235 [Tricholoma furcatifolium]
MSLNSRYNTTYGPNLNDVDENSNTRTHRPYLDDQGDIQTRNSIPQVVFGQDHLAGQGTANEHATPLNVTPSPFNNSMYGLSAMQSLDYLPQTAYFSPYVPANATFHPPGNPFDVYNGPQASHFSRHMPFAPRSSSMQPLSAEYWRQQDQNEDMSVTPLTPPPPFSSNGFQLPIPQGWGPPSPEVHFLRSDLTFPHESDEENLLSDVEDPPQASQSPAHNNEHRASILGSPVSLSLSEQELPILLPPVSTNLGSQHSSHDVSSPTPATPMDQTSPLPSPFTTIPTSYPRATPVRQASQLSSLPSSSQTTPMNQPSRVPPLPSSSRVTPLIRSSRLPPFAPPSSRAHHVNHSSQPPPLPPMPPSSRPNYVNQPSQVPLPSMPPSSQATPASQLSQLPHIPPSSLATPASQSSQLPYIRPPSRATRASQSSQVPYIRPPSRAAPASQRSQLPYFPPSSRATPASQSSQLPYISPPSQATPANQPSQLPYIPHSSRATPTSQSFQLPYIPPSSQATPVNHPSQMLSLSEQSSLMLQANVQRPHRPFMSPLPAPPTDSNSRQSSDGSIHLSTGSSPAIYTSVDPFRDQAQETPDYVAYPDMSCRTILVELLNMSFRFFSSTFPRQLYLIFLLWLPNFYFSRVARIFDEADMTMPEIEKMALQGMASRVEDLQLASPASIHFKATWENFIDSLLKEWKTLNIVSVLLLSAILALLQINSAASDPITRSCALLSLICALMSLLYGCVYIIRFSGMRKTHKALQWAKMAQKTKTLIWWNVWVLLALPSAWLAWSLILCITCIMTFTWRSSAAGLNSTLTLSAQAELIVRIVISVILVIGGVYFALILATLRRYGESMDKDFKTEFEAMTIKRLAKTTLGLVVTPHEIQTKGPTVMNLRDLKILNSAVTLGHRFPQEWQKAVIIRQTLAAQKG